MPLTSALFSPGFNINTQWQSVWLWPDVASDFVCVSVAPDETLWFGTTGGLWSYNALDVPASMLDGWSTFGDFYVVSVAAISFTKVAALITPQWQGTGGPFTIASFENGVQTSLPALPNSDVGSQIAASSDGELWVLGLSGTPYRYSASDSSWLAISAVALATLAVGSAENVWALDPQGNLLQYTIGSGFSDATGVPAAPVTSLSACADGSVWIAAGASLFVKPAGATWPTSPLEVTSPDNLLVGFTASSRYRLYQAVVAQQVEAYCLSYGIVDQVAVSWPAMTTGQVDAYNLLSQYLIGSAGASLREQYDQTLSTFSEWHDDLSQLTWAEFLAWCQQSSITPTCDQDDWSIVQTQLLTELHYVELINILFGNIASLNTQIESVNNTLMPGVWQNVGLTAPSGTDGGDTIGLVLGGLFQAALWGIATMGTGGFAFAASAVASLAGSVISALQGDGTPAPPSTTPLTIQFVNLTTTMASLFTSIGTQNSSSQTAIVSDWGMMSAVGEAIQSGQWTWPDTESATIAAQTAPAFEYFFYQFLMPANWQIVGYTTLTDATFSNLNNYYTELTGDEGWENVWFCNGLGAPTNLEGDLSPFPAPSLLSTIFDLARSLGDTSSDFYQGLNGWNLTRVGIDN